MIRKVNVLVVDDEAALRRVLQASLTARGFLVEEAASGERAIEMAGQRNYDLLVLDINMPGMGGMEACHRIRVQKPYLGIVMVTVRDDEEDVVQALEAGADDYITKPFRLGELVARLRDLAREPLRSTQGPRSSRLVISKSTSIHDYYGAREQSSISRLLNSTCCRC